MRRIANANAAGCFMLLAPLFGGLVSAADTGNAPARELWLPQRHAFPAEVKFVHDHVVLIHRNSNRAPFPADHSVAVLDRSGREVFARAPGTDVPDTRIAVVEDAALTADGILIVSASLWSRAGQTASVLAEYDITRGSLVRTVRINPVSCLRIAAEATSGIWCLGIDVDKHNAGQKDFDVIYQYSLSGALLGSLYPRSEFVQMPFRMKGRTYPQLVATNGRIVAWLPASDALLVWNSDRTHVQRFSVPPQEGLQDPGDDLAILPGGNVIALKLLLNSGAKQVEPPRGLLSLDGAGKLTPLANAPELPRGYRLAGTDGQNLVFFDGLARRLVWLPVGDTATQ